MPYINREKQYESQRKWHARNREKVGAKIKARKLLIIQWLDAYRQGLKCARCPENDPVCLDFHHLDPAQKDIEISLAVRNGWSIERIKEEIAKCIVLCSNCHRKLHASERTDKADAA